MRIASAILKDFAPFKDTGINELHVSFTEKVQIILGTNGSGKSQFLKQLSPYPPTRGMFEDKKGFKSQVFERDGVYYRLESEFEKPSSPHLFFEGDSEDNLNQGRTTETQRELIIEHLGITPVVNDLIMNTYNFPKWGAAKRKEFLMGVNPDQIGFVLPLIKQTATKIKSCKNNLSRLQARKILLEQDLLDDDTLASIEQERQAINLDLNAFQQNLMDIEVGLRTLNDAVLVSVSLDDLPAVRKMVKRYHYQLSGLSHISRDDQQRQSDREQVLSKIAVCDQRLEETDAEIVRKSDELNELETQYRELAPEADTQRIEIESVIQRLEGERDRLQIPRPAFELSEEDLSNRYRELDTLKDKLHLFSNLTVPLIPSKRRQHRERMLQQSEYRQSTYRQRLNDLHGQYEDLSKQHQLTPRDIPDSPCAKDACPLYAHFMGDYKNTEAKRRKVSQAIEKGNRKIKRLDLYAQALSRYLQESQPYVNQIQWLIGYAQSNPILHHVLRPMDILSVLSTNPNRITQQLQDAYDRIAQWLKLKTISNDLETAYALKSRQLSSENSDTVKLVTTIEDLKKSLYGLRNVIMRTSDRKKRLQRDLHDITTFSQIKATLLNIQRQHHLSMQALAERHEQDKLTILRKGVEDLRSRHFVRLSDIERTLRSQSSLKDRYQEEVLSQIGGIEKELADLQQIESALIAIPKANMIGFINDVFDQANRLIETIWTVPLKIELLKIEQPLTYDFNVSGDNQSLREMSECSEGQTEVLSLAMNLALRIILGYINFPLCLDETGRTFDDKHKHNLIILLKRLLDDNVISQLFYVSHHAVIHEGFNDTETMVVREDNVLLPEVYNQHVTLT